MNGMAADDLDAMMLDGLVDSVLPALEGVAKEHVLEGSAHHDGGDRLLDILLRVGPYGDKFAAGGTGLNLDRVKAEPHGVDLGPLQAGILPELLNTEGSRIRLLHPLLEADIARLESSLAEPVPEMVLIGRRHIRDMNSWLHNLKNYARGSNRCTLYMHPEDAANRGIADGDDAQISSVVGSLQVPVEYHDGMMPGVVSLPHGFGHRYPGTRQ
ncbi:MAG: hypothetical protein HKN19_00080, partial [Halioglobus sp.]|nr:hypothetical protein [Halioglobus sp.]